MWLLLLLLLVPNLCWALNAPTGLTVTISDVAPAPAPVALWKFDEGTGITAADSSGNANALTIYNGAVWQTNPTALKFDGINDIAQRTAVAPAVAAPLTLTANLYWLGNGADHGWIIGTNTTWLFADKTAAANRLCYGDNNAASEAAFCTPNGTLVPQPASGGAYAFVAASTDGQNPQHVALWINGTKYAGTINNAPVVASGRWGVGGYPENTTTPTGTVRPFGGFVRYARLYNIVLSDTQIITLGQELSSPPPPLVDTPVITSVPAGSNNPTPPTSVTITTSAPATATKCYTLDGSTPAISGITCVAPTLTYSAPFNLSTPTTVNVIAAASGYQNSQMATASFSFNVASVSPCDLGYSDAPCQPDATGRLFVLATDGSGNFSNLQTALNALTTPGDTLQIKNGTYGTLGTDTTFTFSTSGTRGHPITVMAYPGHTPKIRGHLTQDQFKNVSWRIFDGLEITDCHIGMIIHATNSDPPNTQDRTGHMMIRNMHIHHCAGEAGLFQAGGSNIVIETNTFDHNGLGGQFPGEVGYGLLCSGLFCSSGGTDVFCTQTTHCHGTYYTNPGTDCLPAPGTINNTWHRNKFIANSGSGAQVYSNCETAGHFHDLWENNIFINNTDGMFFWESVNTTVRNNTYIQTTFPHPDSSARTPLAGFDLNPAFGNQANNIYANNVFYTPLSDITSGFSGTIRTFTDPLNNAFTWNIKYSHNAFFTLPTGYWAPANTRRDLTGGEPYASTTGDVGAVVLQNLTNPMTLTGSTWTWPQATFPLTDPNRVFANLTPDGTVDGAENGDFHLQSVSPLRNAGDNASYSFTAAPAGVTVYNPPFVPYTESPCAAVDFDNNPRTDGLCDVGAYEYGANLVQPANFIYQGAFRVPQSGMVGSSFDYASAVAAYNAAGDPTGAVDGYPGSLLLSGHVYQQMVAELKIPVPVNSSIIPNLPTAVPVSTAFVDVSGGTMAPLGQSAGSRFLLGLDLFNGGDGNKLYSSYEVYYNAAGVNPPTVAAGLLPFGPGMLAQGGWSLDALNVQASAGYLVDIPSAFATTYTGGRRLAAGRTLRNLNTNASWGPALYAFAPWQFATQPPPVNSQFPVTPLLFYPSAHALPGITQADSIGGGTWLEMGAKQGVLFVGYKGTLSNYCYGTGQSLNPPPPDTQTDHFCYDPCNSTKGTHAYPYTVHAYLYDPADLARVAQGGNTWDPQPYASWDLPGAFPSCHAESGVGGVAYDRVDNILFVAQQDGENNTGRNPLVLVYKVQ